MIARDRYLAGDSVTPFNPVDRSTWPELLTLTEACAILRRKTPNALRRAVCRPGFTPAPFQRKPLLWRKADLIRHLDSPRGHVRRVA